MKIKGFFILVLAAIVSSVTLISCYSFKPKIKEINPAFGKHISGYTSGMVTRRTNLRIELSSPVKQGNSLPPNTTDPVVLPALPDSNLLEDIFSFEPKIEGKAVWISDRIIEFIPKETLPVNQFYNVEFKLDKVAEVPNDLETFEYQFSTFPQNVFVTIDGLRSYDDYNIEWQKLTGKVTTSDYEDTATVRKVLTVMQNGKKLPVKVNYTYTNNETYFYVDSIERKESAGKIVVSWDGEAIGAFGKGTQEVVVPGLRDFSVTEVRVIENEEQYVEITFSDPIKYGQNLKGIVNLKGVEGLTYSIEGNLVKMFLPNRIVGAKDLTVTTGIKNFKGYKMLQEYNDILQFNEPKPLVRLKGNGCILPNSNGLIFPFEAISLKALDVRVIKIYENNVHQFLQVNDLDGEDGLTRVGKIIVDKKIALDYDKTVNLKQWNKHVIDLGKLITPDPGAIYRVSIKFNREYALCDCEAELVNENNEEVVTEEVNDQGWNERDWDRYGFGSGYESWEYYYDDNYSACDPNYYYGKAVSRNILASDIGLIYKLDDNKMSHAFVSNMITAKPIANASVEYYDYTKQLIASGITDVNGMLDVQLKKKPFLMLAKSGKQRGYLKLLDGYTNSLSKFDVEGEVVQKGVKGFIYGERGVWRPGDSLYLTFIMEDKEKRLPPNHPVKFELQDPNGQVIYQATKSKNVNGMYDFRTATSDEAPTGNYLAIAHVGNRTFTEYLKVETVKPNRLKIYLD
ncbi:MAG TPA: MG2 domain-containing protein, partial [Bacteroidia bacterium]